KAVAAGIIASSNGSERMTPRPRRTVRRERCFLVTNIALSPAGLSQVRGLNWSWLVCQWRTPHPEGIAERDPAHDGLEPVILFGRVAHDRANGRHVLVTNGASERKHHQLLGQRLDELLGTLEQRLAEIRRPVDFGAVGQRC